ncbi:transporter [Phenylobacterium sp.]|jgi:MFS family permease|uniref:transporter n=1 Tax=Phenylobacterium sp. TaxID=1871053 RepID=UPI0035B142F0
MGGPPKSVWARALTYGGISMLLGLTQGLGFNLVNNNLPWIQGSLGAYPSEAAWLATAYTATNATIALLAIKFRFQFGIRLFGDIGLGLFILVAVAHLFTDDLRSAIAVRAASGVAATALSTLALLYMINAVPEARRPMGIALGVGWSQLAAPLSRLVSSDLLEIGQWHGLYLLEIGLSLLCLAAVNLVRLPPVPRMKMFQARDFLTFALFAPGIALLCAVLSQGRFVWWFDAPWLGWALAAAIVLLAAAVLVELHREQPLLHVRWLSSADMLRLVVIILLFRIVLSEQGVGAFGFLQAMGMNNDQMHGLSWVMFWATLAGVVGVAMTINPARVSTPALIALLLIAAAAFWDARVTNLTRPEQMYLSQGLIAFASALFLPAAMLAGFSRALRQGQEFIVSFAVIFGAGQSLGALAGSAFLGTLMTVREKAYSAQIVERLVLTDPQVALRARQYAGAYGGVLTDPILRQGEGLVVLGQVATREATVLAYADVFRVIGVLSLVVFVYLLALRLREDARAKAAQALVTKAA